MITKIEGLQQEVVRSKRRMKRLKRQRGALMEKYAHVNTVVLWWGERDIGYMRDDPDALARRVVGNYKSWQGYKEQLRRIDMEIGELIDSRNRSIDGIKSLIG